MTESVYPSELTVRVLAYGWAIYIRSPQKFSRGQAQYSIPKNLFDASMSLLQKPWWFPQSASVSSQSQHVPRLKSCVTQKFPF